MSVNRRRTAQAAGNNFLREYYSGFSSKEREILEIDAYLKGVVHRIDPDTHALGGISSARAVTYAVQDQGDDIGLPCGDDGVAYGRYIDSPAQRRLEEALSFIAQGVPTGHINGGTGRSYERPLAVAVPAGMSALANVLHLIQNIKDKRDISIIVAPDDCYGGTRSLIKQLGINVTYAKGSDEAALQAAYDQQNGKTDAIIFETLTNPFAHVADTDAIVRFAKKRNIITIADSTLAPFSRPVLRGADIDTISLTKYATENAAIIGGVIFHRDRTDLLQQFIAYRNMNGSIPGAQEVLTALNGLTTMVDSYRTHSRNGKALAQWLMKQPQIAKVYYPGLGANPQTDLTEKYLGDLHGGLMTVDLKGSKAAARAFIEATRWPVPGYGEGLPDDQRRLISVADSFGAPVTLINYMRNQMSRYRGMDPVECAVAGITDGTLRVAVGAQDAGYIIAAFAQALTAIPPKLYQQQKRVCKLDHV